MKDVRVIIKKDPLFEVCPSCGSAGSLRRSHSRNKREKLINHLTIYKTYRCRKCGWRGYLKTLTFTTAALYAIIIYLAIILGSAFITLQILKRLL